MGIRRGQWESGCFGGDQETMMDGGEQDVTARTRSR